MPKIDSPIPTGVIDEMARTPLTPAALRYHAQLFQGGGSPDFYRGLLNGLAFLGQTLELADGGLDFKPPPGS